MIIWVFHFFMGTVCLARKFFKHGLRLHLRGFFEPLDAPNFWLFDPRPRLRQRLGHGHGHGHGHGSATATATATARPRPRPRLGHGSATARPRPRPLSQIQYSVAHLFYNMDLHWVSKPTGWPGCPYYKTVPVHPLSLRIDLRLRT